MLSDALIEEFDLIFLVNDNSKSEFEKMIDLTMRMIGYARELISDDELIYLMINPLASSIMNTIAILLDDDDADAIARGTDQIAVMIMDSFAD